MNLLAKIEVYATIEMALALLAMIGLSAISNAFKPRTDPVRWCLYHRNENCPHVDGFLCKFPKCNILSDYHKEEKE